MAAEGWVATGDQESASGRFSHSSNPRSPCPPRRLPHRIRPPTTRDVYRNALQRSYLYRSSLDTFVAERDVDRYLERIGLDPAAVESADRETLATLQAAHARAVPFETLSIGGHPYGAYGGEPVVLEERALYEKIVERERGGFCYELNGAFSWLLREVGFDVDRCAARVASDHGGYGIPADHLSLLITLGGGCRVLVDVGVGAPVVRRPIPLDGTVVETDVGTEWRLVAPDRPDADFRLEYRDPRDGGSADRAEWTPRYITSAEPRDLSYFEASCEYHSTAPDSHFTGDPVAMRPTADGHVSLSPRTITRTVRGEQEKREIEPGEYDRLLAEEIGLRLDG